MRSPKYTFCFFVTLLLFSITTTEVNACTCGGDRPPCEAYWEASAVFIGAVTGGSIIPLMIEGHQYQQRLVTFAIETAFRGVEGSPAEVITGMGGGDCGFAFRRGERYLVYTSTNPEDKKLHTSICHRTRALSEAGEDLEYIRGLASAVPGALIFGEVQRYRQGTDRFRAAGEYEELLALTQQVEAANVKRIERLSELAKLRKTSLPELMKQLGIKTPEPE